MVLVIVLLPYVLLSRKWKNSIIASTFTARAWDYPLAQSVERWPPLLSHVTTMVLVIVLLPTFYACVTAAASTTTTTTPLPTTTPRLTGWYPGPPNFPRVDVFLRLSNQVITHTHIVFFLNFGSKDLNFCFDPSKVHILYFVPAGAYPSTPSYAYYLPVSQK